MCAGNQSWRWPTRRDIPRWGGQGLSAEARARSLDIGQVFAKSNIFVIPWAVPGTQASSNQAPGIPTHSGGGGMSGVPGDRPGTTPRLENVESARPPTFARGGRVGAIPAAASPLTTYDYETSPGQIESVATRCDVTTTAASLNTGRTTQPTVAAIARAAQRGHGSQLIRPDQEFRTSFVHHLARAARRDVAQRVGVIRSPDAGGVLPGPNAVARAAGSG
jgi:hypothetical protein